MQKTRYIADGQNEVVDTQTGQFWKVKPQYTAIEVADEFNSCHSTAYADIYCLREFWI